MAASTNSEESRGSEIIVVAWVFTGIATVISSFGLFVKARISKELGWDDLFILLSMVSFREQGPGALGSARKKRQLRTDLSGTDHGHCCLHICILSGLSRPWKTYNSSAGRARWSRKGSTCSKGANDRIPYVSSPGHDWEPLASCCYNTLTSLQLSIYVSIYPRIDTKLKSPP